MADRIWWKLLVVGLVSGVVCFWGLGDRGLTNSEGHRVVPAAEFLERLDDGPTETGKKNDPGPLVPTMFETVYVRKPPGLPWAIAAVSAVFAPDGSPNEWTARSVGAASGVLMALAGVWFGQRWFKGGLASGLAIALLPTALSSVRSAEIEGLNNLATMLAVVTGVSLLADASRRHWAWAVGFGWSVVLVVLVKGPASLPVVGALIAGAAVARRDWKVLAKPRLWASLLGAAAVLAWPAWVFLRAGRLDGAVSQGVDAFLFEPGRIARVASLPFVSFAYQLPASIAPLFAFGWLATREMRASERAWRKTTIVRALAWAWVIALVVYTLSGVSNPRYTLPAACLPALCVGYVVRGLTEWFVPLRRRVARVCLLGVRWAWLVPLVGFAVGYLMVEEPDRAEESGRSAGRSLGDALAAIADDANAGPGPIVVVADGAIEARPEVLWYAERRAAELDVDVTGHWASGVPVADLLHMPNVEGRVVFLLRDDAGGREASALDEADSWRPFWSGEAGRFAFRAFVRTGRGAPGPRRVPVPDAVPVPDTPTGHDLSAGE
ncbi:MAG: hypothetical protein AAF108_05055 [Planctomycetota bacterium]